jgi:hypothetical protein
VSCRCANRSPVGGTGSPIASASARRYPAPIPSYALPPESTASVVTAFTSNTGDRNDAAVTELYLSLTVRHNVRLFGGRAGAARTNAAVGDRRDE